MTDICRAILDIFRGDRNTGLMIEAIRIIPTNTRKMLNLVFMRSHRCFIFWTLLMCTSFGGEFHDRLLVEVVGGQLAGQSSF